MKKAKCPACGKTAFQPATYAARRDLDGRRFTADIPARKCASCDEVLVSGPGMAAFERAITLDLARGGEVGAEGSDGCARPQDSKPCASLRCST